MLVMKIHCSDPRLNYRSNNVSGSILSAEQCAEHRHIPGALCFSQTAKAFLSQITNQVVSVKAAT
jgi:hypothetical protein